MQSSPFLISFFVFPWLFLRLRHSSDIAPRFSPDYECTQPRRYSRDETTRDDEAAVNGKRVGGRWHLTCSPWKSSTISSSPASLSLSLCLSRLLFLWRRPQPPFHPLYILHVLGFLSPLSSETFPSRTILIFYSSIFLTAPNPRRL